MDALAQHLRVLGLDQDATLEQATAAYKDLIRVWHPDRFESDPKLRKKAEEQTRLINLAIAYVRVALKNGRPPSKPQEKPTPPPHQFHQPIVRDDGRARASGDFLANYPVLSVYQTRHVSLYQLVCGLAIAHLGWLMGPSFNGTAPAQAALGLVLIAHGLSSALLASLLICLKRPIISINRSFVRIIGTPTIPIEELLGTQLVVSRNASFLTMTLSSQHVATLPFHLRWLMQMRYFVRGTHYELRASILDTHPAHIINALQRLAPLTPRPPTKCHTNNPPWVRYANVLATLSIAVPVLCCFIQHNNTPIILAPDLILFLCFRMADLTHSVVLIPAR